MSHYILDIETKPDASLVEQFNESIKPDSRLKDPVKIAADIEKKKGESRKAMSVDQDYCEVVCIGIKEIGKPGETLSMSDMEEWCTSNLTEESRIITFNGKAFDIPIIIKSGIKLGLKLPYGRLSRMCEKYRGVEHIDLMNVLSFGSTNYKSLDTYLRIYLGQQKETLGDEFFRNASDEDLKKHCLEDLQFTEDLFMKFRFLI